MKKQTELARKSEKEMGDLYAFSRRLAAASSAADIYLAIEEHLASLVQRKVVLFGAVADGDRDVKPEQEGLSQRVHSAIAEIRAGRTLATTWTTAPAISGWSVAFSQKNADFGVIAIDLGSVPPGRGRGGPPPRRRRAVGCGGHARAARCRARAQRCEDAVRDRAVAGGADRLGVRMNCARRWHRSSAPRRC
jgi:hypothetical protein